MREKHEAGKLPEFIADLVAPKALDGLPSLQAKWDELHTQYKESLYQALVKAREEKLATQYSPAIRDEIIKSLVADTKKICHDKAVADPAHKDNFEAEGRAVFSLFTKSITLWEQQAREQALNQVQKQQNIKDAAESKSLDRTNVSDTELRSSNDTNKTLEPHWPAATRPQIPPLSSEGHFQQQRKGKGQQPRGIQAEPQGQLQRELKGKGRSRKGKGNVNTIQPSTSLTIHNTVHNTNSKPKNRRLSKAQKNRLRDRNDIFKDLVSESAELKLMNHNLREIGVAQK